jgi:transposase
MNRRIRIQRLAPQDRKQWQTLYYRHQQQHLRRRLLALKAIWDGQTLIEVCRTQGVQHKTLETWLDAYLHGGFAALLASPKRPRAQTLSPRRRNILRYILLHKTPADYGQDCYVWTAKRVQALIEQKWGVSLKSSRLYQIFAEMGLSHQRAHRDYGPAKAGERAAFVADIKKNGPTAGGCGAGVPGRVRPPIRPEHPLRLGAAEQRPDHSQR